MSFASKRLCAEAELVLKRAGFQVNELRGVSYRNRKPYALQVERGAMPMQLLKIVDYCVDNAEVEKLLARGV